MPRLLVLLLVLGAGQALANPVEQACIAAGRVEDRGLCTCIGMAASITLDNRDQRQAAEFFRDPDEAEETRMSDRRRDEAFWDRYQAFGQMAEDMCG